MTDDGDRSRSDWERDFTLFIEQFEIPPPTLNVPLLGYEADALWPKHRLIVELDSWSWHGGHAQWQHDHEKSAAFEAADFEVLRLNYDDVNIRRAVSAKRILRRLERQPHTGQGDEPERA